MISEMGEKRNNNMAKIRARNTKIEIDLRHGLHHIGYRYRLFQKELPGKPDIFLPKYKAVIFVNGCFWHGHDCRLFRWPKTNSDFWSNKILGNKRRDADIVDRLIKNGYKVCVVWECAMKGMDRLDINQVIVEIDCWLRNETQFIQIYGK